MSTRQDVIAVSSGHPVPADPKAASGDVNLHPGPDFDRTGASA